MKAYKRSSAGKPSKVENNYHMDPSAVNVLRLLGSLNKNVRKLILKNKTEWMSQRVPDVHGVRSCWKNTLLSKAQHSGEFGVPHICYKFGEAALQSYMHQQALGTPYGPKTMQNATSKSVLEGSFCADLAIPPPLHTHDERLLDICKTLEQPHRSQHPPAPVRACSRVHSAAGLPPLSWPAQGLLLLLLRWQPPEQR